MFKTTNVVPVNRYALWQYIMIVLLIALACLYALPNLFGESPAVQVSPKGGKEVTADLVEQVKQTLQADHITYTGLSSDQYNIEMRFADTEAQLKAQDRLEQTLGKDYTVAINLAPNTPQWLLDLGAYPMKLGLDLRGGMYFMLDVDMQSVLNNRLTNMKSEIIDTLRKSGFAWRQLKITDNEGLYIQLLDSAAAEKAAHVITSNFSELVAHPGVGDKASSLYVNLTPNVLTQAKQYAIEQTVQVMRNRVNELGVSEASVSRQGSDRVVIELPGMQDAARAKNIIGGTATLKVMLQDESPEHLAQALNGEVPFGDILLYQTKMQGDQKVEIPVLLKDHVVLTGKSVVGASAGFDQKTNQPIVSVNLSGPEVSYFSQVTGENVGHGMAIVLVEQTFTKQKIGDQVITRTKTTQSVINVANILERLGSIFQISGIGNFRAAQDLALMIRAGALPAPVQIVEQKQIGPTLGVENIKMGSISVAIAMFLVIVFMAIYYRLFGLIADLALVLNLIFIVAVMSLIPGATLTLPGIAGIVLNVGMAIDANVLIFERIREELRNGTTPQAAIHAGYSRAFSTIVDSNVTTLIVAVILFAIGTGAVQGFAVTLIIGIITSMFTAIMVTRALVNLVYGGRSVKRLSIGIKV